MYRGAGLLMQIYTESLSLPEARVFMKEPAEQRTTSQPLTVKKLNRWPTISSLSHSNHLVTNLA